MWPVEGNSLHFYRSHSPKSVIILLALQMERLNHTQTTCLGPESRKSCPRADRQSSGTQRSPLLSGGCWFSWKPQGFWVTFSSPPTESAFYLLFGMQSNRTPCEFYLSPNLLHGCGSCRTGLNFLAADRDGVVSGLSGRNLGGRALSVKFEFGSHTVNRILETHSREEKPLSLFESGPSLVRQRGWMVLLGGARITGNCLHQKTFPLQAAAFIPYVSSYVFPSFTWMAFLGLGADAEVSCLFRQRLLLLQLIPVSSGTLLGVELTAV